MGGIDPVGGAGTGTYVTPAEQAVLDRISQVNLEASSIGPAQTAAIKAATQLLQIGPPPPEFRYMALLFQNIDSTLRLLGDRMSDDYIADAQLSISISDFILAHLAEYDISERMQEYNDLIIAVDDANINAEANNLQVEAARAENAEYNATVVEPHNAAVQACIDGGGTDCGDFLTPLDENVGTILPIEPLPDMSTFVSDLVAINTDFIQFIALTKNSQLNTDDILEVLVDTLVANFEQVHGAVPEEDDVTAPEEGGPAPAEEAGIGAMTAITSSQGSTQETTELMQFVLYSVAIYDYLKGQGDILGAGFAANLEEGLKNAKTQLAAAGIGSFLNNALDGTTPTNIEDLQGAVNLLQSTGENAEEIAAAPAEKPIEEPAAAATDDEPVAAEVRSIIQQSINLTSNVRLEAVLNNVVNETVSRTLNLLPIITLQEVLSNQRIRGVALEDEARAAAATALALQLGTLAKDGENFDKIARFNLQPIVSGIEDEALREAVLDAFLDIARLSILRVADNALGVAPNDPGGLIANANAIAVQEFLGEVNVEVITKLDDKNLDFIVESFQEVMDKVVSMDAWLTSALDPAVALVLSDSMFRSGESGPASLDPNVRRTIDVPS